MGVDLRIRAASWTPTVGRVMAQNPLHCSTNFDGSVKQHLSTCRSFPTIRIPLYIPVQYYAYYEDPNNAALN